MSRRALSLLALGLLLAPSARSAEVGPAAGGVRLVEAMEDSPVAVVAWVGEPRQIDLHGYTATARVEQALKGAIGHGDSLQIAWEELALGRPPRFGGGDRVLLSLEPLPSGSIWLQRFPEPAERLKVLHIAMRGDAFLRNPSPGSINVLEHYLALAPEERSGPRGAFYLAQLAAASAVPLAHGAVERLTRIAKLDEKLDESAGRLLVKALLRGDATERLEGAILDLIAGQQLETVRPELERLASAPQRPPPVVFTALGRLDAALSPERTALLLEQSPPQYRAVAARFASFSQSDQLVSLLRSDPAAEVRVAAVRRLVALRGEAALEPALAALDDPDATVRRAAAKQLGTLGAAAVPRLRDVVDGWPRQAALAAVFALSHIRAPAAREVLVEVAASHRDESVRMYAEVALSGRLGKGH